MWILVFLRFQLHLVSIWVRHCWSFTCLCHFFCDPSSQNFWPSSLSLQPVQVFSIWPLVSDLFSFIPSPVLALVLFAVESHCFLSCYLSTNKGDCYCRLEILTNFLSSSLKITVIHRNQKVFSSKVLLSFSRYRVSHAHYKCILETFP